MTAATPIFLVMPRMAVSPKRETMSEKNISPFQNTDQWQALKTGLITLARQEILPRFHHVVATRKADGSLLTEADTQMQKSTQKFLRDNWPQFDFLGEESSDAEQIEALQSAQGCWILDPLDGTSNFSSGIPIFTVSLALVVAGELVAGIVYDPERDECFAARKGQGAELNGQPLVARTDKTALDECISLVDFKRLTPPLAIRLATEPPYASQRSIGSVALDWCWIAAGRGQLYLHGAQNIWDYAAGELILTEAGGHSATLDGEPVFNPRVEKRSAVAATSRLLCDQWCQWLSRLE